MDPLSVTASVLAVVEVAFKATSALIDYTSNTKDASADRKLLIDESRTLLNLLERLRISARNAANSDDVFEERQDVVQQFSKAFNDFATILRIDPQTGQPRSESRGKQLWNVAKWSFTKGEVYSILERISRLQLYSNTLLLNDQHALIERIHDRQQDILSKETRASLLSWISALRMNHTHESIARRPEAGSGRWFLTSQKFREWQGEERRLLWCPGIPGAGKTVMACIAFQHLRQQRTKDQISSNEIGVAIVYLKYNDPQQTLENIVGSVVAQLAQELDILPMTLSACFEKHSSQGTTPILADTADMLSAVLKVYKRSYIIIDALDECSEEIRWDLIEKLKETGPQVKLLVTSRFLDSIDEELMFFERFEIRANKADLELFIDHHILKNKNLRRIVEKSPPIKQDIKSAVVATAEDMFLLARLHIESLSSAAALSIKFVRKKLESLPNTLVGTYDEAMKRIEAQDEDHKAVALKTLAWVSYAFRPLSLGELQHALAIEPESTILDEEDIMDGHSITALCAGLVVIDQGTDTVTLVHYTTKKYFEDTRETRFPGFHATITMSCATYLALDALKNANMWTIVRDYPLAYYAAQYMGDHARQHPEEALEQSILQVLYRLLSHPEKRKPLLSLLDSLNLIRSGFYNATGSEDSKSGRTESLSGTTTVDDTVDSVTVPPDKESDEFIGVYNDDQKSGLISETDCGEIAHSGVYSRDIGSDLVLNTGKTNRMPEVTALHLAASMGLARVASLLIRESRNIDAVDETGKTALALAMERGFEKAVEFLVVSGARVDLSTDHGRGIFLLITERDWGKVAQIIAERATDDHSQVAAAEQKAGRLLFAAYHGDNVFFLDPTFSQFLEIGENCQELKLTSLFVAVERHHSFAVQRLLDIGVDVNSKDSSGQSALHRATRRGHQQVLELLIENGAEINCQDDEGRTAWSANLRSSNEQTLDALLTAGADPNVKGLQGVSELYIASQNGETSVVKYMLKSGTDPSIRTQFDWAPLHWASYYGHVDCVNLLIHAGAELSPVSDQDASPLDLALRAEQTAIASILTKAGAKESRDLEQRPKVTPQQSIQRHGQDSMVHKESHVKLTLTFDKPIQQGLLVGQFIYPSMDQSRRDLIYQISHPLDTIAQSFTIRLSDRRADMVEYPLSDTSFDSSAVLYNIVPESVDYQHLELRAGSQGALTGTITMIRDWTGGWKVRRHQQQSGESEYLFRTTPDWSKMKDEGCRWMMEEGALLARTGLEDVTPTICFEYGVEREMRDILVACWAGKMWSEAVAVKKREKERGGGS